MVQGDGGMSSRARPETMLRGDARVSILMTKKRNTVSRTSKARSGIQAGCTFLDPPIQSEGDGGKVQGDGGMSSRQKPVLAIVLTA